MKMRFSFHNGEFIPSFDVKTPITEAGVFTTALIKDGKVFFLQNHIKRIYKQCRKFNIPTSVISIEILKKLLKKNDVHKGLYRLKIIVIAPLKQQKKGSFIITIEKEKSIVKPVYRLCIYKNPAPFSATRVKNLAYHDRLLLREFAQNRGFDDCLTFDANGYLLEASIANVFWIKNTTFYFPSPQLLYFRGIVLTAAIILAKKLKLQIHFGKYKVNDLEGAQLFYCNSMKGILPVKSLEGITLLKDFELHGRLLKEYSFLSAMHAVDLTV